MLPKSSSVWFFALFAELTTGTRVQFRYLTELWTKPWFWFSSGPVQAWFKFEPIFFPTANFCFENLYQYPISMTNHTKLAFKKGIHLYKYFPLNENGVDQNLSHQVLPKQLYKPSSCPAQSAGSAWYILWALMGTNWWKYFENIGTGAVSSNWVQTSLSLLNPELNFRSSSKKAVNFELNIGPVLKSSGSNFSSGLNFSITTPIWTRHLKIAKGGWFLGLTWVSQTEIPDFYTTL